VVLLAHLALVFWLGERPKPVGVVAVPEALLKVVVDPPSVQKLLRSPLLSDPALFALPSSEGFSGGAWLQSPANPPPRVEWSPSPQWLPLDTNELGAFFSLFVATNKHSGSVMDDRLIPRATTADILLLNDPLMTQTVVRIEGPLAGRTLVAPIMAPNPAYADVLPDTIVQLRVNRDGMTESAILLKGCGETKTDDQALATARSTRFQPIPPDNRGQNHGTAGESSWGKMIFQWFTVTPTGTNLTALTPY